MEIIVQKTSYYNTERFFEEAILEPYVSGVAFNLIFSKNHDILIFSPNSSDSVGIMNLKDINSMADTNFILDLKDALDRIRKSGKRLKVLLNLIPISYDIIDDASFQELAKLSLEYMQELKKIIDEYPDLDISLHSISRNLLVVADSIFSHSLGFFLYGADLNLMDVDYYVFTTNMIDDTIFEQELARDKGIYLQLIGSTDLALVVNHYDSKYSTALSQKVLPHLGFIVNQPNLIYRLLAPSQKFE